MKMKGEVESVGFRQLQAEEEGERVSNSSLPTIQQSTVHGVPITRWWKMR